MADNNTRDYDVVVVGGGGAGMSAAIVAADAGARVALLEAGERVGGSTALSGGVVYAAETAQQKARGVEDSINTMIADIQAINGDTIPREILHTFGQEAHRALAWLGEIGVDFPADRLRSANGRTLERSHEPPGFGAQIAERLDYELSKRDIDLACNTRVEQLSVGDGGGIKGVVVEGENIKAPAVVLACGGIGGDPSLLERMIPKSRRAGDWVWYVGCATNRGDGLRMAEAAGANICGEDSGLFLMTPNFYRDLEVIGPDWVMLVNAQGERIVREDAGYWELAEALEALPDARGFCIFTRDLMLAAEPDPLVLEALAAGSISLSWIPRVLEEQLKRGRVQESDSIAGLAAKIGMDAEALQQSITRYNSFAGQGADADFGKVERCLKALSTPPYYAVEVRPAVAIVTGAGPAIDAKARVLKSSKDVIPGLFAAGEITGDVYGRYYVGSGHALAAAISFGRIAGREAAAFAASATRSSAEEATAR